MGASVPSNCRGCHDTVDRAEGEVGVAPRLLLSPLMIMTCSLGRGEGQGAAATHGHI